MKALRGEMIGAQECLGYDYSVEKGNIIINAEEADIVRYIFRRYLEGAGATVIGHELDEMGCATKRGNKQWNSSTVLGILKNEKYRGDVLMGKTYTVDPISKRRMHNYGEEDQYRMNRLSHQRSLRLHNRYWRKEEERRDSELMANVRS